MQHPDETKKTSLDGEITVDLIRLAPFYHTAVLISVNDLLASAVNAAGYRGVRIELLNLR